MNHFFELNYYGEILHVSGNYTKATIGNYEEPPEPSDFEIKSIHWKDIDVTDLFIDSLFTEIQEKADETY